ncbi:MAG: zf-HC2 domain-containing protein [Acidobacteria bacterium]|nr:zf-HC2 domain-containing protein [Acidobacteriota bacterium]
MLPHRCHLKHQIPEFLENRLDPARHRAMEIHLEDCESCHREVETWRWIQQNCARHFETPPESRVISADCPATKRKKWPDSPSGTNTPRLLSQQWVPLLCGLLLVVTVAATLRHFLPVPNLPSEVAEDYRKIREGKLSLERYEQDAKELDRFFSMRGVPFDTKVADLRDLHYRLVGGRVHQLINRRSVLYVYQGRSGELLLCEMFVADTAALPSGGLLREGQKKKFLIYRAKLLNLVFWQDGNMMCVLASNIDSEQLLQAAELEANKI